MRKALMMLMLAMMSGFAMAEGEDPFKLNIIGAKDGSGDVGYKLPVSMRGFFILLI